MYSLFLLTVGSYWAVTFRTELRYLSRNTAFIFCILLGILFSIYSLQIINYSPSDHGGFWNILSPDGERYLRESQIFSAPWHIDELSGRYQADGLLYTATPKMGLSAFVSVFTIGWTPGLPSAYAIMLAGVALGGFIKLKLVSLFKISPGSKIVMASIVVLFPTDLYFSLRFLREPIANDLFVIGLLILCLNQYQGRLSSHLIKTLPLVVATLILWRVQLALVLAISCIILTPITRRSALIFVPLIVLSLFQMVRATSVMTIANQLDSELVRAMFVILIKLSPVLGMLSGPTFVVVLLYSTFYPLKVSSGISPRRFNILVFFITIPWITAELGQIRFIYPAIIWIKTAFTVFVLHNFQLSTRRISNS